MLATLSRELKKTIIMVTHDPHAAGFATHERASGEGCFARRRCCSMQLEIQLAEAGPTALFTDFRRWTSSKMLSEVRSMRRMVFLRLAGSLVGPDTAGGRPARSFAEDASKAAESDASKLVYAVTSRTPQNGRPVSKRGGRTRG